MQEFAQLLVNGLINGSAYGLVGVSFAFILSTTGRFHLAFIATYMLTAYVTIWTRDDLHFPLIAAIVVGLVFASLVGVLIEIWVYRPIAARAGAAALFTIFVASLGLTILAENVVRLIWGSASKTLTGIPLHPLAIGTVRLTVLDVISALVALALILLLALFLQHTKFGRIITAVRVNPEMASAVGIDTERVFLLVFAIGTALGGVAALFYSNKYAAVPDMGYNAVFIAFVVAFLAGTSSSPQNIFAAGLFVGAIESLSGLWLKTQWSPLVVFSVLFIYVSLAPFGVWSAAYWRKRFMRLRVQASRT